MLDFEEPFHGLLRETRLVLAAGVQQCRRIEKYSTPDVSGHALDKHPGGLIDDPESVDIGLQTGRKVPDRIGAGAIRRLARHTCMLIVNPRNVGMVARIGAT